jgi:hypothetical protein
MTVILKILWHKHGHSVHWMIFLYVPIPCPCPASVLANLDIFFLSLAYSFLSAVHCCRTPVVVFSHCQKVKTSICLSRLVLLLWREKNLGQFRVPKHIVWVTGTELLKTHKTRTDGILNQGGPILKYGTEYNIASNSCTCLLCMWNCMCACVSCKWDKACD